MKLKLFKSWPVFAAFGLGALASVGFAPLFWWHVAFIVWATFLYILLTSSKQIIRTAFAFGCGPGAVSMAWIVHA